MKENSKILTIGEHLEKEIDIKRFRKLIESMYRGFPNSRTMGIENVIVTENVRDSLVNSGFLIKEKHQTTVKDIKVDLYVLGPSALSLVSAWKTEELTNTINKLTWGIFVLTIILVILTIKLLLV